MKIAKLFLVFSTAICICGCNDRANENHVGYKKQNNVVPSSGESNTQKHAVFEPRATEVSKDFVVLDSNGAAYKYLFYKRGTKEKYYDRLQKIDQVMGIICCSKYIYNSPNNRFWTIFDNIEIGTYKLAEIHLACIEILAEENPNLTPSMKRDLDVRNFNCSRSGMILAIGMLGNGAKDMVPILVAKLSHFPTPEAQDNDDGYDSEGKTLMVIALAKIALESEELRPQILRTLRDWQGKDPDARVETAVLEMLWLLGDRDEEKMSLLKLRRRIWLLSNGVPSEGYDERAGETLNVARAYNELGTINDKYTVSALRRCMNGNYWRAPGNAALALGNFKDDPRAMPALVHAFDCYLQKYPWSVDFEWGITQGLKNLGFNSKEQTVPVLIKNLETKDREILLLSIRALRTLGPLAKASLPKLKEIAENDREDYFRDLALLAVKNIENEKID